MNTTQSLISTPWGPEILALIEIVLATTALLLSTRTALIRDDCPGIADPFARTYSMGKTQLAFWSVLIIGLFVWIYFETSQFSGLLNSTCLILLGISVATTALSKVAGESTPKAAIATVGGGGIQVPPQPHVSFLSDILSDANGMNIHRVQMLLWTLTFGFIFVAETVRNKTFPNFDDKIYGLMGLSSGTYVWFKRTEA